MTGARVAGCELPEARPLAAAAFEGMRAARMKGAAGRRIERRRDLAFDRLDALAPAIGAGRLAEERDRVGVVRRGEEGVGRRALGAAAGIHAQAPGPEVLYDRAG